MKIKPTIRLAIAPLSLILLLSTCQISYGMDGLAGAAREFTGRRARATAARKAAEAKAATAERTPATAAIASAIVAAAAPRVPAAAPLLTADSVALVTDASRTLTIVAPAATESLGGISSPAEAPLATNPLVVAPAPIIGRTYAEAVAGAGLPNINPVLVAPIPVHPSLPGSPRATSTDTPPAAAAAPTVVITVPERTASPKSPRATASVAAAPVTEDTCGIAGQPGLLRWVGAAIASTVVDITPIAYIKTTGLDPYTTRISDVEADLVRNITANNSGNVRLLAKWLTENPRFRISKTVLDQADEYMTTKMDAQRSKLATIKANRQTEIRRQLAALNLAAVIDLTREAATALVLKQTTSQLRKLAGDGYGSDDETFNSEFKAQLAQELAEPAASYAASQTAVTVARLSTKKAVDASASDILAGAGAGDKR